MFWWTHGLFFLSYIVINLRFASISAGTGHASGKVTLIYPDLLDNKLIDSVNEKILEALYCAVSK